MTFRDIEHSLPNGFHDAEIKGISLDCLSIWQALTLKFREVSRTQTCTGNSDSLPVIL